MIGDYTLIYCIAIAWMSSDQVGGTIIEPLRKLDSGSGYNLYRSSDARGRNEYNFGISKREPQDTQESPDSKERRSQMGSSFIRFGRNRIANGNPENADYVAPFASLRNDGAYDEVVNSRNARGRSDVIIRFGRGDANDFDRQKIDASSSIVSRQLAKNDLAKLLGRLDNERRDKVFHRHDDLSRINDPERANYVCANLLPIVSNNYVASNAIARDSIVDLLPSGKLIRLCNSLGSLDGAPEDYEENDRRVVTNKIIEILGNAAEFHPENVKRDRG